MLNLIRPFWGLIQANVLGWARASLVMLIPALVAKGWLPADQQSAALGVGCWIAAMALSSFDKFVVNAKVKKSAGLPTSLPVSLPPAVQVAADANAAARAQVTMQPIPNPA